MKRILVGSLLLIFLTACARGQERFEPTLASTRRALARGEIKEALASYEAQAQQAENNAAASWVPQRHWETAAAAYTEASRAAWFGGELQRSVAYGEKALQIAQKIGHPQLQLLAIVQLIQVYSSLRTFDKTRQLLDRGFEIARELPLYTDPRIVWEGSLYHHLGLDLLRRREHENAIDAISRSVHLQEQHLVNLDLRRQKGPRASPTSVEEPESTLVVRRIDLGRAYRQTGKLEQALEQYQRAFGSIKGWRFQSPFERSLYQDMGELYRQQGNFPRAQEHLRRALALAEQQQYPVAIRSATVGIGEILHQTGNPTEAIPYYHKAIQHTESARSLLESEEHRQSFFEGALGPYVNMMRALLSLGKPEDAFDYNERARSRVFLDLLGSKTQLSRARSGLLEEERALQERIAAIKTRLAGGEAETTAEREILRKELAQAERAYAAFLAKVRKQDKEQASLMAVEPLTLREVQELLDPGTTLLEYFVAAPNLLVWVVERDRTHAVTVPLDRRRLSNLVRTLRESLFAFGEKETFTVASTSLYQHLIQRMLPHVHGKELIIVPHDVLHYLPFQALISPEGRYLIEDFPIYYLSSASLLQFVREKRKGRGDRVMAVGNPDLGDPSKNLRFAEVEALEIRRLYPQSTVLLGKGATEERSKALSPQHDILHFATHAELNEDDPLSSAILLAKDRSEDGRLEVREVFGMDLRADLVVLSACETGLGKLSSGDELVGLTRAFIYAGTPSVVASLWKVEDSSTAALMASFYRNLRTMSKVEALRQAQLELLRGESRSDVLAGTPGATLGPAPRFPGSASVPSTSHPYFWAPFILVGDPQ